MHASLMLLVQLRHQLIRFDSTRESESHLLQDAKRFTVELEKQRMELEKVLHIYCSLKDS